MERLRTVSGFIVTWAFSSTMFFAPLFAVLFLRLAYPSPSEGGDEGTGDTGLGTGAWEASWGGGGSPGELEAVADATVEGSETIPDGTGLPADASSPKPRPSSSGGGGGSGGGTGGGQGTGTGPGAGMVTMLRPGGNPNMGGGGAAGAKCEPLLDGIVLTGPRTWSVERRVVDDYANLKMAKTLISRIDRHQSDLGEWDGVQIFGIPCGSPLALAGFKNGDVIHDINGYELTGIPAGLLAWRKVRNDDVLVVNISRRGATLVLTYNLG